MASRKKINSMPIRILIVEDYDGDALLISEKLRISQVHEYSTERTTNLKTTLEWLDENVADVILLDMGLGDSDGLDTVNAVFDASGDAAIVVLTGRHDEELGFGSLELGAQDFLAKDEINARNLRRIVAFALSRQRFQLRALKDAIARMQQMATETADTEARNATSQSAHAAQQLSAKDHSQLTQDYRALLKTYLDSLVVNKAKPKLDMQQMVTRLGLAGAGPKDVLALHVAALEDAMTEARPERARYLNTDGRLLALEVMGRLVAYYRATAKDGSEPQA